MSRASHIAQPAIGPLNQDRFLQTGDKSGSIPKNAGVVWFKIQVDGVPPGCRRCVLLSLASRDLAKPFAKLAPALAARQLNGGQAALAADGRSYYLLLAFTSLVI